MDLSVSDDILKFSALSKLNLIGNCIKDVTIGPNCKQNDGLSCKTAKSTIEVSDRKQVVRDVSSAPNVFVPMNKMLEIAEVERQNVVKCCIRSRLEQIQAHSEKINDSLKVMQLLRNQRLQEQDKAHEQLIAQTLEEHAKNNEMLLKFHHRKQEEERNRRSQENQMKEKHQQLLELFELIHKQYQVFRMLYQEVLTFIKSCSKNVLSSSTFMGHCAQLKSLTETMEKIKDKCKTGKASSVELTNVTRLVQELSEVKTALMQETVQTTTPPTPKEPEPIQVSPVEPEPQPPPPQPRVEPLPHHTAVTNTVPEPAEHKPEQPVQIQCDFASSSSLHMWAESQRTLETIETITRQFSDDPKLKQLKFNLQKAINIPLNAISSANAKHLLDKYQRLDSLLRGVFVDVAGASVSTAQHPTAPDFCFNLLAKKFVSQGDLMVSSNPESAHCFAVVLTALWADFPNFGRLVLGHFHREAPYLVPVYPPQIAGQSDQDYYCSLGYRYEDGTVERHDKFLKRMSGMTRLYAAVTIARPKRVQQAGQHPHGLSQAWRWLGCILNLEPRMDITATLLFDFLEVTGSSLQTAYGRQFQKLLTYLCDVFLPQLQKIDSGGPVTRLEVLLLKARRTGQFETPKGKLSDGFI